MRVSGLSAGCGKPFELERDCSAMSGAKRAIEIKGVPIKVAGSEDGRFVLMMSEGLLSDASWGPDHITYETNRRYELVKETLASRGVNVVRVIPMVSSGAVMGYFVEFDGDGYGVLVEYSS